MNDIDLSSIADWTSIGTSSAKFTGVFDGNGHVIKNLKSTKGGLFGYVSGGEIKNIGLENVNINSTETYVGGLINVNEAGMNTTQNCYAIGSVTGANVGGLIGDNSNMVYNCYFEGDVRSTSASAGGLIGTHHGTSVHNCYTSGSVSAHIVAGGLIGEIIDSGQVSSCYTASLVRVDNTSSTRKGGLAIGTISSSNGTTKYLHLSDIITTPSNSSSQMYVNDTYGYKDNYTQLMSASRNYSPVSNDAFSKESTWTNFDSNIWDKTTFPPTLKNMPKASAPSEDPERPKKIYNFKGSNEFRLQIGDGTESSANAMHIDTGISMGELEIDLSTTDGCLGAIDCIAAALDAVAQKTADIGVAQSRLETISNVNTTKIENLTSAYTTVTEVDVAEEVANFTKSQIMAQTASSLIAQTQAFQANLILRMINSLG